MCSPATTLRNVKRMTKYNERKANDIHSDKILEHVKPILSITILPQINIFEPQVRKRRNLSVSILLPTSYFPESFETSLPSHPEPITTQDFISLLKSQEREQEELRRQERARSMLKFKEMLGLPP